PPTAWGTRARAPGRAAPLAPGLQPDISSMCFSLLHPLKKWSLRETRNDSVADLCGLLAAFQSLDYCLDSLLALLSNLRLEVFAIAQNVADSVDVDIEGFP